MERQRLRTFAELHAAVDIQRTWRGTCGRYASRKRATIFNFARIAAEEYADPSRFAQENMRAFNAHKGFLGHARIDARTLLAAAAGSAKEVRLGSRGKGLEGASDAGPFQVNGDVIRLRLKQDRGDQDIRWNGESECHYDDGVGGGGTSAAVGGITGVDVRVRLVRKCTDERNEEEKSLVGKAGKQSMRPATVALNHEMEVFDSDYKARKRQRVLNDCPPVTLKLELISVQKSSDLTQDRVTIYQGMDDSYDRSTLFCEVNWCGEVIGGTRSPLGGYPIPRWEGQVFHLPLSAISRCSGPPTTNANDYNPSTRRRLEEQRGPFKNRHQRVQGQAESPRPQLLAITLNKLVISKDDRAQDNDCNSKGRNDSDRRDTYPNDRLVMLDAWSAFLSGFSEPQPVARTVLEADDVLCMLGSQQVRPCHNDDSQIRFTHFFITA